VCKQVEEYLLSKLSKDHAGVKLKVLRILRYVCENGGSIEFRRLVQRRSDIIRQCQSYRGTSDPLRGDAPNKDVRDEAQNVMKALFATENSATTASSLLNSTNTQSRIQSVSSSDFGSYTIQSTFTNPTPLQQPPSGGRCMASMGNPNFDNYGSAPKSSSMSFASLMTSENPGRDIISAVTSGVQSVAETLAKTAQPYISKDSTQSSRSHHYTSSAFPPTPAYEYAQTRPTWTPPQVVQESAPPTLSESPAPSPDSLLPIRSLVNELCVANSARTNPSQQSLDVFVRKAENLDGSVLGQILALRLNDPQIPWVHKIKLLCGVEAVHSAGLDLVVSSFLENGGASALIALLSSVQCGSKARQVAHLLGLVGECKVTSNKPQRSTEQLINFDDEEEEEEVQPTRVVPNSFSNDLLVFDETPSVPVTTPPSTSLI